MAQTIRKKVWKDQKAACAEIRKQLSRRKMVCLKPFWRKLFRPYSFLIIDRETGAKLVLAGQSACDDVVTLQTWIDSLQAKGGPK